MFCTCYFDSKPAAAMSHDGHGTEHYCRFNNAYHVDKGNYGKVKLDGAKFWVAGDLGAEFSDGEMDWAVVTFDPSVTKEQREGIASVPARAFPFNWKAFSSAPVPPMGGNYRRELRPARSDAARR